MLLYLIDVNSDKQEKIAFDLDGVFTASWSPNGEKLAFVGNEGGASDIYTYEISSKKTTNLTNDVFSDTEPSWSPDGEKIVFVSDRGVMSNGIKTTAKDMIDHNYEQSDIFIIDLNSKNINQITNTGYNENYPIFSNTENKLFYTG